MLNILPSRCAGLIPVLRTTATTTTATTANEPTTGSTRMEMAAVTSASTNSTEPRTSCSTAIPDRLAPMVTTWMMSLRRRANTNAQRAVSTASNAS